MRQEVIREKATMLEAERSPAPIEGAGKIIIEMLLPYLCDNNISHVESTIFNSDPNRPIRRIRSLETKLGELYYLGDGHIYMYFLVKNA